MATYYVDCVTPRTTAAVWTADTVKALGNRVWSTSLTAASAKYIYEATDIGSSPNKTHATTEPTWPTTVGNTVVDADITWTCRAPDSWDEALPGLQGAADLAVAGDTVYCRGTQTTTATIDFDTNAGTNAGGFIRFIGCNDSGTVDGTRFILNANGGSFHVVTGNNTADYVWFENIEVKNTGAGTYHGFHCSANYTGQCIFINCCANTCGANGWNGPFTEAFFWRCVAYSNTGSGFSVYYGPRFLFCSSRDNTNDGFEGNAGASIIGCVSHNNSDDGLMTTTGYGVFIFNSVFDGNADDGILISATTSLIHNILIGNRITNHSGSGDIGLNCGADPVITGFNYFENNDGDNIRGSATLLTSGTLTVGTRYKIITFVEGDDFTNVGASSNATGVEFVATGTTPTTWTNASTLSVWLHYFFPLEGGSSTSNLEDLSNTTSGGYVDPTNHDFSTNYVDSGNPDLRRTAITIPWS